MDAESTVSGQSMWRGSLRPRSCSGANLDSDAEIEADRLEDP
jgi:hypothetical protein